MYYFAYGTNMNLEHMRRLCGWHLQVLGRAILPDYELGGDLRGYANIRPQKGSKVFGVLYEIDQKCLDTLDEFEGYPEIFGRAEVEVVDDNRLSHKGWVYLEAPDQFGAKSIKEEHLKRIISGARENRLPEDWLQFLESFF